MIHLMLMLDLMLSQVLGSYAFSSLRARKYHIAWATITSARADVDLL